MPHRILIDGETLAIGLAYPGTPQGQIVTAWRHGRLELVLGRSGLEELAKFLDKASEFLGWSTLDIIEMISAITLMAIVLPPGATAVPPILPKLKGYLPEGASVFVTEDESYQAWAAIYPIMTPKRFWETYG